ncbi:hypothetical protein C0J52_26314 [Blattella germanica]|nr:hypothetical protein C0J52_26314 [Blattella germanica]
MAAYGKSCCSAMQTDLAPLACNLPKEELQATLNILNNAWNIYDLIAASDEIVLTAQAWCMHSLMNFRSFAMFVTEKLLGIFHENTSLKATQEKKLPLSAVVTSLNEVIKQRSQNLLLSSKEDKPCDGKTDVLPTSTQITHLCTSEWPSDFQALTINWPLPFVSPLVLCSRLQDDLFPMMLYRCVYSPPAKISDQEEWVVMQVVFCNRAITQNTFQYIGNTTLDSFQNGPHSQHNMLSVCCFEL